MAVQSSSSSVPENSGEQLQGWKIYLVSPDGEKSVPVTVEVADNDETRARGLMYRETLHPDAGMLFQFPDLQERSFWMKNTKIPLDIIFYDDEWNIISNTTMTPCDADPCPSYSSGGPAKYALEVNAGFLTKHGITQDWSISLPW